MFLSRLSGAAKYATLYSCTYSLVGLLGSALGSHAGGRDSIPGTMDALYFATLLKGSRMIVQLVVSSDLESSMPDRVRSDVQETSVASKKSWRDCTEPVITSAQPCSHADIGACDVPLF